MTIVTRPSPVMNAKAISAPWSVASRIGCADRDGIDQLSGEDGHDVREGGRHHGGHDQGDVTRLFAPVRRVISTRRGSYPALGVSGHGRAGRAEADLS